MEYKTPFAVTIFYHESLLEQTVAKLCNSAQLIPLLDDYDPSTLFEVCEYITPEVIIFDNKLSADNLQSFIARGFQVVHVFDNTPTVDNEAVPAVDDTVVPIDDDSNGKLSNIVMFNTTNFFDHLPIRSMLKHMIITYVLMYTDVTYKPPSFMNANHIDANHFVKALKFYGLPAILNVAESFRGFDAIADLVTKGSAIFDTREREANKRLCSAVVRHIALVNPSFVRSGAKYIVYYSFKRNTLHIKVLSAFPITMLDDCANRVIVDGMHMACVPHSDASKYLTFLQ
jgi:hypothetical protein